MTTPYKDILARWQRAQAERSPWESLVGDCYRYTMPGREPQFGGARKGPASTQHLYDGTAADAAEELVAEIQAGTTPALTPWFRFTPDRSAPPDARQEQASAAHPATNVLRLAFERSNFDSGIYEFYLDLVSAGTACLLFREIGDGDGKALSPFAFEAVPFDELCALEGPTGLLDQVFRRFALPPDQVKDRYRLAQAPAVDREDGKIEILEAQIPVDDGYEWSVWRMDAGGAEAEELRGETYATAPYIVARWSKAAGEVYGRGPIMKALPDIKTLNKAVELVLKNASIAVTGIWQADDDGVLNPANIKLVPGTIIPKAVGSKGLQPLDAPGRFDVSELVITQLRERIRRALFVGDMPIEVKSHVSASEMIGRQARMARILSSVYARLQSEFLDRVMVRAITILARRDGAFQPGAAELEYLGALAQRQLLEEGQNTMLWMQAVMGTGAEGAALVDVYAAAVRLRETLGVRAELIKSRQDVNAEGLAAGAASALTASSEQLADLGVA